MTDHLLRAHVASHLDWLVQRIDALEAFHVANAKLVLNDFCDWFVRDELAAQLAEAIRYPSDAAQRWYEQANREQRIPPLPEDPIAAMGFRFSALRLVRREKVDLKYFVANNFPGSHLNETLMHYKRLIVHPFAADCRLFAELGHARLGDEEWVLLRPFIADILEGELRARAFGPRAWTDADDEAAEAAAAAPPPARPAAPPRAADPLAEALAALEAEVAATGDPDLALDLEALRLEAARPTQRTDRLHARLGALASHAALGPACARVRGCLPG